MARMNDQRLTNLLWECCISYSTSIDVIFVSLKTTGGQVEADVDFVISDILM